jgi:hypothetical protein
MRQIDYGFLRRYADELEAGQKVLQTCHIDVGEIDVTTEQDAAYRYIPDGRYALTMVFWDADKAPQSLLYHLNAGRD